VPVADLKQSSQSEKSSSSKSSREGLCCPEISRMRGPFQCTSPLYLHLFLSFLHCVFCLRYNTILSFAYTSVTYISPVFCLYMNSNHYGKAVPLQVWSGPEGSKKLRFPDFMTTAQDGGKVVSLTHWPPLPPGNTPGTHFC
jgi:hypothetical protein